MQFTGVDKFFRGNISQYKKCIFGGKKVTKDWHYLQSTASIPPPPPLSSPSSLLIVHCSGLRHLAQDTGHLFSAVHLKLVYWVSQKKATIQIQISTLIQTTYCIQFQRMQFHIIMIRSFSSCPMCIKLCVFMHSSFKSDNEFQNTTISCLI